MNSKLKELEVENLFEAILCLENMEECYNFFEDLCTVTELKALSQRFQVAKMLDSGKVYSDIVATTGASSASSARRRRTVHLPEISGARLASASATRWTKAASTETSCTHASPQASA
mgnify:CR=1 FL=1